MGDTMAHHFELNDKDFKTRKLWLRVNFFCSIVYPVIAAVVLLLLNYQGSFWQTLLTLAMTLVLAFFVLAIPFYILYYCAYAKPGTRLLTWVLCLSPIGIGYNVFNTFKEGWDIGRDAWFTLAVSLVVFSWTYVLNLRLRKINKVLQVQEGYACTEFHQELLLMKNTLSLEVLDYAYHQLVDKWPQWEYISSLEYKRKKQDLARSAT